MRGEQQMAQGKMGRQGSEGGCKWKEEEEEAEEKSRMDQKEETRRGGGEEEIGEMPQAAERRHNCHMQSFRGCVRVRECAYVCINHSTPVLCHYLSEQGNLPPSALRQTGSL